MNFLQKLKRAWRIANLADVDVDRLLQQTPRDIAKVVGDGNAEFLPDMTEDERDTFVREHELGWKRVFDKVRKIMK